MLATKDVKLMSDLKHVFIKALRRFSSMCNTMWSDNGKNFVGANRKLKKHCDLFSSKEHQARMQRCVSEKLE